MKKPVLYVLLSMLSSGPLIAQASDTPPSTPTGLTARAYSSTAGGIRWLRSTDDHLVHGYEISRDGVVLGIRDTLSVVEFDLDPATTYRYGITAIDSIGQRSGTATVDLTTLGGPATTAPAAPENLHASVYSSTAAELFWTRSIVPGLHYEVSRDGHIVAMTDGISYFTARLASGTDYVFEVVAINSQGVRSPASQVQLTTAGDPAAGGPAAPQNLRADVYSSTAAELFWTRSSVFGMHYEISRDGSVVATIDGTSYFDDTLQSGSSYLFEVVAIDREGLRSGASNIILRTFDDGGVTPPMDQGDPYAEPNPDGSTFIARSGYPAAFELADDLLSGSYLSLYQDIHSAVNTVLRSDSSSNPITRACPEGGTVQGYAEYFQFDVVFDNCRIEGRTLNGALRSEFEIIVFGLGSSQKHILTFTELSVDAGSLGSLKVSGSWERYDLTFAENTAVCGGAPTITHNIGSRISTAEWQRDGVILSITNADWSQLAVATPSPVEGQPPCLIVDTLAVDGAATVTSTLFGQESEPATLDTNVDITRDSRTDPAFSGTAGLVADFGDGSRLTITASPVTDGKVQVDIVDAGTVVSFIDDYRFDAR